MLQNGDFLWLFAVRPRFSLLLDPVNVLCHDCVDT